MTTSEKSYQVLARKYRSQTFDDLIGQDVLVRTLTNAFQTERIAHAYMLTGIRGVGKTSTARIMAKGLNCTGPENNITKPTVKPCNVCESCSAITQDRHIDVIEMDAASHTGVNDIREILEAVPYRPTMARYKVYIIDEVHMLSTQAFNALLKTLEEPPAHVKFIFATTEIRKVPVTILSRCQRFDLQRIETQALIEHYRIVAEKEKASIDPAALQLIAQAADGSARDGLSILDQAIAHSTDHVTAAQVSEMLGLANKAVLLDIFDSLLQGNIKEVLALIKQQYKSGADSTLILKDLLDLTHFVSSLKVMPLNKEDISMAESEAQRAVQMAEKLSMPILTRTWQMLLKGLSEIQTYHHPLQALEMIMVRIAYAANCPTPEEIISKGLKPGESGPAATPSPSYVSAPPPVTELKEDVSAFSFALSSLDDIFSLLEKHKEMNMAYHLKEAVHLVNFNIGHLEINLKNDHVPKDFIWKLAKFLEDKTQTEWKVSVVDQKGHPTIKEQETEKKSRLMETVQSDPLVQATLNTFPGAMIGKISITEPAYIATDIQEEAT